MEQATEITEKHNRRSIDKVQAEIHDIHEKVVVLDRTKFNKPNQTTLVALVVFLGSIFVGGVNLLINNATITSELSAIKGLIKEAGGDRFRGADAVREFALRDQRMESLQNQIDRIRHTFEVEHEGSK